MWHAPVHLRIDVSPIYKSRCLYSAPSLHVKILKNEGQCTYVRNIKARSRTHCYHAMEKQYVLHIPSGSVAFVIQHEKSLKVYGDVPCGRTVGQMDGLT